MPLTAPAVPSQHPLTAWHATSPAAWPAGFILAAEDIIWPFRIFTYVLPLRWTVRASAYFLFINTPEYAGGRFPPEIRRRALRRRRAARAGTADCAPAIASNSTDVDLAFCSYRDFYCPDNPPQQCWGRTGAQILDSLGAVYDVYSSADATAACLLIIAGWALLTKLLYFYFSHTAIRGVEPRKRADTRTPCNHPPSSDDVRCVLQVRARLRAAPWRAPIARRSRVVGAAAPTLLTRRLAPPTAVSGPWNPLRFDATILPHLLQSLLSHVILCAL